MKEFPFINMQCPYCGNRMSLLGAQSLLVPNDEGEEYQDFDGTAFVCAVVPEHTMILALTKLAKEDENHERQDNKNQVSLCSVD